MLAWCVFTVSPQKGMYHIYSEVRFLLAYARCTLSNLFRPIHITIWILAILYISRLKITKLSKSIKLGKDPWDRKDKKNIVYKINCKCGKCYIGKTKRPLRIQRKKHFDDIKLNEKYHNAISKNLTENGDDTNHCFLWEKTSVLHHETNFYKRNFAEMVCIKKEGSNSIKKITDFENLNKSYNMLLDVFL